MALYSRKSSGTETLRCLLHDHLGSGDAITTSGRAVELRESFEAFGGRRGSAWSGVPSSAQLATMRDVTRRGYTGHEHLDSTALIHLNGRVYDPALGRFISADPGIDGALNTQGWNAYAYVKNNPLSFSDPTGFSRSPPTTRVLPIDPHSGLETITVEASRLYDNPIGPMFGFGGGGLQGPEGRSGEMEEIVVTGRRSRPPEPPASPDPATLPKAPPQGQQDPDPCTADGTIGDFLQQHGLDVLDRTLSIVGGVGQIGLGIGICSGAVSCAGGVVLGAHGASNVFEGVTGSRSLIREGYRGMLGSAGDLAYSAVDISSSVYGMTRGVLRPGAWSLFRNISSDYVPAFRTMTGVELIAEGASLISDVSGAAGITAGKCRR